jgi:glycosyltransferase involved in cell wall biosynthesis
MIGEILFWSGAAFTVTVYGGYGMWVSALARLRPVPTRVRYLSDDMLPDVTCVLTAANEGALIDRKLALVADQDYPPDRIQVIVVSDGSTDGTDQVVSRWQARDGRIQLYRTAQRSGKPSALNLARASIRTEITVLMDVRQEVSANAIRELVAHLADQTVGAVSGDLQVKADRYWTYEGHVRKCESRSGSMVQVTGSLYAVRTVDFPNIPPTTILDDVYVPLQVALDGRRIVMAERAKSVDVVTRSARSEFIRKVRTLAGLVQVAHTVPGCLDPRRNAVWGRFIVHKLARLLVPYALLMMLAGAAISEAWLYRTALIGAGTLVLLALGHVLGIRSRVAGLCQAFITLNLAALWAVPAYCLGLTRVTWARVEADRS